MVDSYLSSMGHFPLLVLSTLVLSTVAGEIMELPEYTGCGAEIRGIPEGVINYPSKGRYPKDADCKWTIVIGDDERMTLHFERYDILKTDDTLVIRNGDYGSIIGSYKHDDALGGSIPAYIESEGNIIVLHFTSDNKQHGKGFKMTWRRMPATVSGSGDNQCLGNATYPSALWQKVNSSETAIITTVQDNNQNVIEALTLQIEELNLEIQEIKNELQTIGQELPESQLEEIKNKQDLTELKLDFIIELLMGPGCWSDIAQVSHPEGFSETRDCVLFTCTNGKWVDDGPDPQCDNSE